MNTTDINNAENSKLKGATYLGCFKDQGHRAIPNYVHFSSGDGSDYLAACRKIAREKGAQIFAMQYHSYCFYGPNDNNYARYGRGDHCSLFCGVQKSGMNCGGSWQQDVYKVTNTFLR